MAERITHVEKKEIHTYKVKNGDMREYVYTRKYVRTNQRREYKLISNFTPEQLAEIRRLFATGVSKKRLYTDYACSPQTMDKILNI